MGTTPELIRHFIDGKPWDHESEREGDVFDPAAGKVIRRVALSGTAEVRAAVEAAKAASERWRDVSLTRRARIMFTFREILESRRTQLARTITQEHGKVLDDAAGEIARGIEVVEFACGIPHLQKGEHSEQVSTDVDTWSVRQPLGVVVGITPFNFPAMVPMWMFPIAIACGNTFVLKPSERDPSAPMLLAEWLAEAGLPDGVLNVLHGDRHTVDALITHPDVRAVSFVGSTPVARHIYATATNAGKRVQALGGAKNHMVVLPDADLDRAADAAVSAGFGSAGERCMAVSVVVAVEPVGDALVEKIAKRAESLVVGDGQTDGVDMGPLVTGQHCHRVRTYVETGVSQGAELVVDGRDIHVADRPDGFWLGPNVFDHVTPEMSIYTDEIFGPVLCVLRAESYDEAVRLVNDNPYGNGVALFTRDGGAARLFQRQIEAGMVGINVPIPVPMAFHSFGGWGESLFGDTHVYGPDGVRFYTRAKVVTAQWADPHLAGPDLGFPTNR